MKDGACEFLNYLDSSMDYPFGGDTSIPTVGELRAFEIIRKIENIDELIVYARIIVADGYDCYDLWIYVVRMAILSGNTGCSDYVFQCLWCIVVAAELIDWRDAMVGLSIIEHSSKRSGFNFFKRLDQFSGFLTDEGKNVINGYRNRSDLMRSIEVMGYEFDGLNKYIKK